MSTERRLSVLVLRRGRAFNQAEFIQELFLRFEPDEVISIGSQQSAYESERLASDFPRLKIILPREDLNTGTQVNLGIQEAASRSVMVIWNDYRVGESYLSRRQLEKIEEEGQLCVVPVVHTARGDQVPTLTAPAQAGRKLRVVPLQADREVVPVLYPFDYCGVYNKDRFVLAGGYDTGLSTPYWQKLEFGFRSRLWGEKITCHTAFRVCLPEAPEPEENTPDASYRIFFLKTLAVKFREDRGVLPPLEFPRFALRSGAGPIRAFNEFRRAAAWVETNTYRYKLDAQSLIELWEPPS